jgi:hypothetical protein
MSSPEEIRPARMWRLMKPELKASAATAFWSDEQAALEQAEAVALIARQIKFRPKSVLSLTVEKKARHLAGIAQVSDLLAARLLIAYHLEHQRPMMGAFLDALGIAHEEGLIADEQVSAPDIAKLKTAAEELVTKFPPADVALYFGTLVSQDPETWGALAALPQAQVTNA